MIVQGAPQPSETVHETNARWLQEVVLPAFEGFAVYAGVWGLGPVVSWTTTECRVEIPPFTEGGRPFEAFFALSKLDDGDIVVKIPGNPRPFSDRTRESVDVPAIREALRSSAVRWLADRT